MQDDPNTSVLESGALALSDGAIDIIDADTLELVGTVPLGRAALSFYPLAIDPTGRVAALGPIPAGKIESDLNKELPP